MAISWLHVSDFHLRGGDSYDRDTVLGALVQSVREFRQRGRKPDIIFATGDIANSGKAAEYAVATPFFDALLDAAGLERRHLFLVPGNHDVDRDQRFGLARTLETGEEADNYFHPERQKPHLLQKLGAFRDWYNGYFQGIRVLPANSTCGPVQTIDVRGTRLSILPLNTALFCQDDSDHNKLLIGRRCLRPALEQLDREDAQLRVILIHHPLDWLSEVERANVKAGLHSSAHIILRGHLHENEVESVETPAGGALMMAAGASYQTRKWPNRALFVTIDEKQVRIFPLRYEDSPREIWAVDPSLFPHSEGYEGKFALPKKISDPVPFSVDPQPAIYGRPEFLPRFRNNIPSRGDRPFLGREALLRAIADIMGTPDRERVLLLHGAPGVGKSELAREFARRQRDRYPGGCFLVRADADAGILDLARIGSNVLGLQFPSDLSLQDQCERTLLTLGTTPTLLIYDNVLDWKQIRPWLPASGMPCHVLVTSFNESLSEEWPKLAVLPLPDSEALELVKQEGGTDVASRYGNTLVEHAGGLPIQIVSAARALGYESRRGHEARTRLEISNETQSSFGLAYDVLDHGARLLLRAAACLNLSHILRDELLRSLKTVSHPGGNEWERSLDACLDLHMLEGVEDMRMHQLFAAFLRDLPSEPSIQAALRQARASQWQRFTYLAGELAKNPTDRNLAHRVFSYRTTLDGWTDAGIEPSADEVLPWYERIGKTGQDEIHHNINHASVGASLNTVGHCLATLGKFDEARPWFELSVRETEQGNVDGCVDHVSVGIGLYHIGYCLLALEKYEEAQPWLERAVGEAELGDVYGFVDREILGECLLRVGHCLSSVGRYNEAQPWFERAVAEIELSDLYEHNDENAGWLSLERAMQAAKREQAGGRNNHDRLGASLDLVGTCLSKAGKFDEARSWYERAIGEREQGDAHGRVDHERLGTSLHQVGHCLSRVGKYAEAIPCFERAVGEKGQGDVHGRIHHENLGRSMHRLGECLSNLGKYDEARPWFERAVQEKEQGDVHGRIDRESLEQSLIQVSMCLSRVDKHEDARPWCERAAGEKERDDVRGKAD